MAQENRGKILESLLLVGIGVGIGYFLWYDEPKIVAIPHSTASTKEGVKHASSEADVYLKDEQAVEVSKKVQQAKKEYTVCTTTKDLSVIAEKERKKSQADFSIITDPNKPNQTFDLSKYDSRLPIELSQYNITAYKKRLHGISYYPESVADWKAAMVSFDYSIRVSKTGKYIGASTAYNFDNDKMYIGIRYEF